MGRKDTRRSSGPPPACSTSPAGRLHTIHILAAQTRRGKRSPSSPCWLSWEWLRGQCCQNCRNFKISLTPPGRCKFRWKGLPPFQNYLQYLLQHACRSHTYPQPIATILSLRGRKTVSIIHQTLAGATRSLPSCEAPRTSLCYIFMLHCTRFGEIHSLTRRSANYSPPAKSSPLCFWATHKYDFYIFKLF